MQINLDFKMVGGLWFPSGSDMTKRIYYFWILLLNLSVLVLWIYSEILKYGLIAVTSIEYQKLALCFKKVIVKLKKHSKNQRKKKVRFSKNGKIEHQKMKLKSSDIKEKCTPKDSITSTNSTALGSGDIISNFHVAVPIKMTCVPILKIIGAEDVFGGKMEGELE
jgi:hypothetical protein